MLKKATLLTTALLLSACGAKDLPSPSLSSAQSTIQAGASDEATLIDTAETASLDNSSESAETIHDATNAPTLAPSDSAEALSSSAPEAALIGASGEVTANAAPDATHTLPPSEIACPTINGSFVLTIGGEIRDRITIQTKRENGKLSYSFNNGEFFETQNKVQRTARGGLARVACDRDQVRLSYRDAAAGHQGRLEVTSLGDAQLKITNADGRIAMSGMYVSAQ